MNDETLGLLPHERLLRACAVAAAERIGWDESISRPAFSEVNWPELMVQSVRHGVAPLVARRLCELTDGPTPPADVSACCRRLLQANRRRNQVLFGEAARLVRALETAGIPCLVLKGVALALTVYPEAGLRHFADIDILVREKDLEAAGQAAQQVEFVREPYRLHSRQAHVVYTACRPEDILTDTLAPEYDSRLTPELLARSRTLVKVEIHRHVLRDFNGFMRDIDMAPFWECPQTAAFPDGTPFRMLSPEAMLVHLCEHAAQHFFQRLLFPVDVALVLSQDAIDWTRVVSLAARADARHNVHRLLDLVRREFGAAVPAAALEQIRPEADLRRNSAPLQIESILRAMQHPESMERDDRSLIYAEFWEDLRAARTWRERLVSCRQILFPPPAFMETVYGRRPPLLLAGFYLYRPFQLTARLAKILYCRHKKRPPLSKGANRI